MVFFGKILKTRGNRGEIVLECAPSNPEPEFKSNAPVILKSEKYQIEKEIEYVREINDTFILKLKGINSIKDAFQFVGYMLFSPLSKSAPEEKKDWLGFSVRDIQGVVWGVINGIRHNGLSQVMEVGNAGEVIYVPFCEEIIREIDNERKLITIDPPEGLRKLNR